MRWICWLCLVLTAVLGLSLDEVKEELVRTEELLELQQRKLTLLHQLRQSLGEATDDVPHAQSELQAILERLKAPKSCVQQEINDVRSSALLIERPDIVLPSNALAVETYRLQSRMLLLLVVTRHELRIHHLPGGQFITSIPFDNEAELAMIHTQSQPTTLYILYKNQTFGTYALTIEKKDDVHVQLQPLATTSLSLSGVNSLELTTVQKQRVLMANASPWIYLMETNGTIIKAHDTKQSIQVALPHRHIIAIAHANQVDIHHALKLGEGPASYYSCECAGEVTSIAFDMNAVSRMYVAMKRGDIYLYDVFYGNARNCRALARMSTRIHGSIKLLTVQPGFLLAISSRDVYIYQTHDDATNPMRFIGGVQRTSATNADLVKISPSHFNGEYWEDATIVISTERTIQILQAALHRHEFKSESASNHTWDPFADRIPLILIVFGIIFVYKLWWSRGTSSVSPKIPAFDDQARFKPEHAEETSERFNEVQEMLRQRKREAASRHDLRREVY